MEVSWALTKGFPWQCRRNIHTLLYIGKKGQEMDRRLQGENSSGFTKEQSPQGGAFSGHLLDQKSKSPLFPGDWLQMKN